MGGRGAQLRERRPDRRVRSRKPGPAAPGADRPGCRPPSAADPQAKQKWHIGGDKDFQATPNSRNEMMLQEAGDFAQQLKKCEKEIVETFIWASMAILRAPNI